MRARRNLISNWKTNKKNLEMIEFCLSKKKKDYRSNRNYLFNKQKILKIMKINKISLKTLVKIH